MVGENWGMNCENCYWKTEDQGMLQFDDIVCSKTYNYGLKLMIVDYIIRGNVYDIR